MEYIALFALILIFVGLAVAALPGPAKGDKG